MYQMKFYGSKRLFCRYQTTMPEGLPPFCAFYEPFFIWLLQNVYKRDANAFKSINEERKLFYTADFIHAELTRLSFVCVDL